MLIKLTTSQAWTNWRTDRKIDRRVDIQMTDGRTDGRTNEWMGERAEKIRAEEKIYGYTDAQADRHTVEICGKAGTKDRQTGKQNNRHVIKQEDWQTTDRLTNRHTAVKDTDRWASRLVYKQIDNQTERGKSRHIDRLRNRQVGELADRHKTERKTSRTTHLCFTLT